MFSVNFREKIHCSENRRSMNGTAFLARIVIEKANDLIINCWVIEYFAQDLLAGSSGPDDEDTLAARRFELKPWEEPDPSSRWNCFWMHSR